VDTTLSARVLNRTLLRRQHLLERTSMPALAMTEHLVGLQAQDTLPPYLSLWSRLEGFHHAELTTALSDRSAARLLLMRGTIHLVTASDAGAIRPWVQPALDQMARTSQGSKAAADIDRDLLVREARAVLGSGPLTLKALGVALGERFAGYPAAHLANSARERMALVQVPPRGLWKQSGGVVYATGEQWLARPLAGEPDAEEIVRRYLRAFGPAGPADVTAWSRVTGLNAVFARLGDELVRFRDERGKVLYDLEGLPLADPDVAAPVRLLGKYDNVWLSHADRGRVTPPENRRRWMGANGGVGNTVFVDGSLEGLWQVTASGRVEPEMFRSLTATEQEDLEKEVTGMDAFLAS
jgi:hypothetical protein